MLCLFQKNIKRERTMEYWSNGVLEKTNCGFGIADFGLLKIKSFLVESLNYQSEIRNLQSEMEILHYSK